MLIVTGEYIWDVIILYDYIHIIYYDNAKATITDRNNDNNDNKYHKAVRSNMQYTTHLRRTCK